MIKKIATAAVYAEDQLRTRTFWIEQVGFEVHCERSMGPMGSWLEVAPPGAESCLVIYPTAMISDWAERKPSVVFECDDVYATHAQMVARGVSFIEPPKQMPWGVFALFEDVDGNQFGLRQ